MLTKTHGTLAVEQSAVADSLLLICYDSPQQMAIGEMIQLMTNNTQSHRSYFISVELFNAADPSEPANIRIE